MEPATVTCSNGKLEVPNNPIIPVIIGDGIGQDVTPVAMKVLDAAVTKAYGNEKKISWKKVLAGEDAFNEINEWLPEETLDAIKEHMVAIKGPLTTPVGGGFRSLNVTLRQRLDLFACVRPVRWFEGVPSPVKEPEKVDMVIFRENTEDIYAGIEWQAGTPEVKKVIEFMKNEMGVSKIRFPETSSLGVKPVSSEGTKRLVRSSFRYAISNNKKSITLVHKGNIMKFTEGGFRDWGYELAREEFGAKPLDGGPWHTFSNPDTGEEKDVFQKMMDAHVYIDENGLEWKRVYTPTNFAIDGKVNPMSSEEFVEKTSDKNYTLGEIQEKSKEMSEKRKEKHGFDPVQKKWFEKYSKKRRGRKHPNDPSTGSQDLIV